MQDGMIGKAKKDAQGVFITKYRAVNP